MPDADKLNDPWLIAVWPGMGSVSLIAGSYLVTKLQMQQYAEFPAREFFDVDYVEVHHGMAAMGHSPHNVFFLHKDPRGKRDLLLLVGESQPTSHRYAFCRKLMDSAAAMGVSRVMTFAAMATQLHPSHTPRVFGVATSQSGVAELKEAGVEILRDGQISGLNGLLLTAAQDRGVPGVCLLGEMPFFAINLPNPKASCAALKAFAGITGIELELADLEQQAAEIDRQLIELIEKMGRPASEEASEFAESLAEPQAGLPAEQPPPTQRPLSLEARQKIEELFEKARRDRSKAMDLKQELDRLGVFKKYEDRFLDLFKKAE